MNRRIKLSAYLTCLVMVTLEHSQVYALTYLASATESILNSKSVELELAFANENWKEVEGILVKMKPSNATTCKLEVPLRILYGHAALAMGKNSAAVEHFYCATDSNGLKAWLRWTEKLVVRKPNLPISHYLRGDALARNGDIENALIELDKALKINPKDTLALNARGVVKWLLYEADQSKEDFELEAMDDLLRVIEISPNFADAWANRGIIGLRGRSDLLRARQSFERALSIDNKYWLALNGKACAHGTGGEYWAFQRDIKTISENAPNTPFLALNAGFSNTETLPDSLRGVAIVLITIFKIVRGGVFLYLKDGENLLTFEGTTEPKKIGTWFALNYPSKPIVQEAEN